MKIDDILEQLVFYIKQLEEESSLHWLPKQTDYLPLSVNEYHLISHIGKNPGINGVSLSALIKMTRGGTSKLITKLQKKN